MHIGNVILNRVQVPSNGVNILHFVERNANHLVWLLSTWIHFGYRSVIFKENEHYHSHTKNCLFRNQRIDRILLCVLYRTHMHIAFFVFSQCINIVMSAIVVQSFLRAFENGQNKWTANTKYTRFQWTWPYQLRGLILSFHIVFCLFGKLSHNKVCSEHSGSSWITIDICNVLVPSPSWMIYVCEMQVGILVVVATKMLCIL